VDNIRDELRKQINEAVRHSTVTLQLPQHMTDLLELGLKKGANMALAIVQEQQRQKPS
jgi:hypothetical protein